jgi:hypothetical protein
VSGVVTVPPVRKAAEQMKDRGTNTIKTTHTSNINILGLAVSLLAAGHYKICPYQGSNQGPHGP